MHIVFLTNEYPKENISHGGIGTFVQFLAKKLVLQDVKVTVLGINNSFKDEFNLDGKIAVHRLKKSNWKIAKFYDQTKRIQRKLLEINNSNKIDIVEGSELNFSFYSKKTAYKKVIRLHGGHHFFTLELNNSLNIWKAFQEKQSFKKADYYIAVSDYVGSQTKKYLNFNFDYTVIYNSIQLQKFYKSDITKEINNKLVFIGTVCEKKGVEQIIKSFPSIQKIYSNLTLEIVGRDWSSKYICSYKAYLKEKYSNTIQNSITFKGAVSYNEIPEIIETAQICIYPSLAESFGLTIIEAMAMGKSVAASNIYPFKEIVGKSESVSFFNPNSIKDISGTIIELLSNAKLREKQQKISRKHILDKFSIEKTIKDNLNFYSSITKK